MSLKAWRLNEHEVYAGETLDEAVAAFLKDTGLSREEGIDEDYTAEEAPDLKVRRDTEEESYTTVAEILAGMSGPGLVYGYGE